MTIAEGERYLGVIPDTTTLGYIAEIYRLLYIEWQFEINKVYHGEGLSICFPFIRRVTGCCRVERLSLHPCTSILECHINIDRNRSNPQLPLIKGPKVRDQVLSIKNDQQPRFQGTVYFQ